MSPTDLPPIFFQCMYALRFLSPRIVFPSPPERDEATSELCCIFLVACTCVFKTFFRSPRRFDCPAVKNFAKKLNHTLAPAHPHATDAVVVYAPFYTCKIVLRSALVKQNWMSAQNLLLLSSFDLLVHSLQSFFSRS